MAAGQGAAGDRTGGLTILAGGGAFPVLVARAAAARGRAVTILAIRGEADPAIEAFPHHWIGRGQLATLFRRMRRAGSREIVMIGGMRERRLPRLDELDFGSIFIVLRHLAILRNGDDGLLRRIARIFESRGLRVIGAAEVAPELLVPPGPLGRFEATAADRAAIAAGLTEARAHGARDLGQGVIVVDGAVALREGPDGTDAMMARFAATARTGRAILVKCPKPTQDRRLDLPAIGPETVAAAARAGLAGIAVEAGGTLVADRDEVARLADAAGLFVEGIAATVAGGA